MHITLSVNLARLHHPLDPIAPFQDLDPCPDLALPVYSLVHKEHTRRPCSQTCLSCQCREVTAFHYTCTCVCIIAHVWIKSEWHWHHGHHPAPGIPAPATPTRRTSTSTSTPAESSFVCSLSGYFDVPTTHFRVLQLQCIFYGFRFKELHISITFWMLIFVTRYGHSVDRATALQGHTDDWLLVTSSGAIYEVAFSGSDTGGTYRKEFCDSFAIYAIVYITDVYGPVIHLLLLILVKSI